MAQPVPIYSSLDTPTNTPVIEICQHAANLVIVELFYSQLKGCDTAFPPAALAAEKVQACWITIAILQIAKLLYINCDCSHMLFSRADRLFIFMHFFIVYVTFGLDFLVFAKF
jgi:hypothetical protein